jgi:hypothetical protein
VYEDWHFQSHSRVAFNFQDSASMYCGSPSSVIAELVRGHSQTQQIAGDSRRINGSCTFNTVWRLLGRVIVSDVSRQIARMIAVQRGV